MLLSLAGAAWYYGTRMRQKLTELGFDEVRARVRCRFILLLSSVSHFSMLVDPQVFKIQLLFSIGMAFAGVYTGVEAGIQHILDMYPVAWFLWYPGYHAVCMTVCVWFILSKPGKSHTKSKTISSAGPVSSRSHSNP